jgi:ABC-2 type transport system ATP-binding protein
VIDAEELTKRFGTRTAVEDLSLHVGESSIYGFLGPNGAGKSTTLRVITGVLAPDKGTVRIGGRHVDAGRRDLEVRRMFGVVSETQQLPSDVTVGQYLRFFVDLYRVAKSRIGHVLGEVGLEDRISDIPAQLSRGQQQKLGIARALLHDPPVLILDEPVSGLDPQALHDMRELLLREKQRNRAILMSSHLLSEVERAADTIGIIQNGRMVHEGPLLDRAPTSRIRMELSDPDQIDVRILESLPFVREALVAADGTYSLHLEGGADHRADLTTAVVERGGVIIGMEAVRPDLEAIYLALTGEHPSTTG